jgi:hypothetical protein
MAPGDRGLDVLRVVIFSTQDDDIFEPPDHEQFTAVQKPQVSGAQERAFAVAGRISVKRLSRLGFLVPIAQRHARTLHPDFADFAVRARNGGLGIDDPHGHSLNRRAAADQGARGAPTARRHGAALRQFLRAEAAQHRRIIFPAATDNQRGLRQAVAGIQRLRPQAARLEAPHELREGLMPDRLGAVASQRQAA